MPSILLINSVHTELLVALIKNDTITVKTCAEQRNHDKNLNKLVRELLSESGTDFNSLSAYAVVVGPGSWTGCRVGVTAVKAYACAKPKPIIAVRTPEDEKSLVGTVKQKFAQKDFTDANNLEPFYDGEFIVNKSSKNPKA